MELVKIALSSASHIFSSPLVTFLPLFGFADDEKQATKRMEKGEIVVNQQKVPLSYVCKSGDLVQWGENGIVIEESK